MRKKIITVLTSLVLLLAIVLLYNTWQISKPIPLKQVIEMPPLPDSAISHMQQAIRFQTEETENDKPDNSSAFRQFWLFVEKSYPFVNQLLTHKDFNRYSRLYKWEGLDTTKKPYVFMAHIDVVPVEKATEKQWTVPPYGGVLKNGLIYGRGVADDKSSVIALLESVEKLLAANFKPACTVYLSFGNDEETNGRGAEKIADWFTANRIHPEVVIDEGGEITNESFPTLGRPVAMIAVAEKGFMSFELSVTLEGGHSSTPVSETAIDVLTKGLYQLRKTSMPVIFTPVIKTMLERIAPGLPFIQRMAVANSWLLQRFLVNEMEKDKSSNALIRTTMVPTILQAGVKDNVIPGLAKAIVNTRIMPGQSTDEVEAFMTKQLNDKRIILKRLNDPIHNGPAASYESVAYKKVEAATYLVVKDVIPVPFLSVGATDSKSFQGIADGVIKFSPSTDLKGYHGIDERITITDLERLNFFYTLLLTDAGK